MNPGTIESTPPERGGTLILMQRHGNYDRTTGHLSDTGRKDSLERSATIIRNILGQIPAEERPDVKIVVVASPTFRSEGQRSMETAGAVIGSVKEALTEFNIPQENLLTDAPRPEASIEEPRIFTDATGYRDFLETLYGKNTKEFWIAYEEDKHRDERISRGAEGPVDMSDRYAHFTNVLGRYGRQFHSKHKEKRERLIIWVVSHYDTITTYFKNHVAGIPQNEHVPVNYDGGLSIFISHDNKTKTRVQGIDYPIELTQAGTRLARENKMVDDSDSLP